VPATHSIPNRRRDLGNVDSRSSTGRRNRLLQSLAGAADGARNRTYRGVGWSFLGAWRRVPLLPEEKRSCAAQAEAELIALVAENAASHRCAYRGVVLRSIDDAVA